MSHVLKSVSAVGGAALALPAPITAHAHVKWFAPFDLTVGPSTPAMFCSEEAWVLGLALSIPALWLVVGIDRLGDRLNMVSVMNLSRVAVHVDDVLRVAIGVWLTWLWTLPMPIFLTPELIAPHGHVQWFQLLMSIFCFSRRTTWITGVGLLALYWMALNHYGIFHLADYPLFLGISAYLIGISAQASRRGSLQRLAHHRLSALVIAMAITLCWASIEKWAYAAWSMPILSARPHLALGLDPATFMALAGWVEFGLAICLVIGGRSMCRLAALALLLMFSAAVFEFGKVDLIGHLPIIAALVVVIIAGNGDIGGIASLSHRSVRFRLAALPTIYFVSLALTLSAYVGGWQLA